MRTPARTPGAGRSPTATAGRARGRPGPGTTGSAVAAYPDGEVASKWSPSSPDAPLEPVTHEKPPAAVPLWLPPAVSYTVVPPVTFMWYWPSWTTPVACAVIASYVTTGPRL